MPLSCVISPSSFEIRFEALMSNTNESRSNRVMGLSVTVAMLATLDSRPFPLLGGFSSGSSAKQMELIAEQASSSK